MRRKLLAMALGLMSLSALAQNTPVGLWRGFDEKTGDPKFEVRIADTGGVLNGKVEKRMSPDAKPDDICTECKDDRKDKPRLGLEIIRGAKKSPDGDVWEGGKILDPENGKSYTLKMTPIEGGKKMEVRGSIGPFGRTQTWVRVN
jgi:uncharacterized protein (DUF2147 family)